MTTSRPENAFLFDVDNTLLDNDRVIANLQGHLEKTVGTDCAEQYWRIFEELRTELGYADYLGALQRYRGVKPHDPAILTVGRFLLDYPFAERVYPRALEVIKHVGKWGPTAILTDGDVVFQPRKVDSSGLSEAVGDRVFIYLHKEQELADVARRCPAGHYVLVEDKLRILTAVKKIWGSRVTTVFVRQGHYAHDPEVLAQYPDADISVDHIGDLLDFDLARLVRSSELTP